RPMPTPLPPNTAFTVTAIRACFYPEGGGRPRPHPPTRHASVAKQSRAYCAALDCFVATLLAMTNEGKVRLLLRRLSVEMFVVDLRIGRCVVDFAVDVLRRAVDRV